ncbi:MAG: hypothetical protein LUG18_00510 [Candidatus Azobacteroides sp.]|nr:hypothetical protein [Candidatus Azobacteroides sp.]
MKKILTLLICISCFMLSYIYSQNDLLIKDMDNDGIRDTVLFDRENAIIICKLSGEEFKEITSFPIEILNENSGIIDSPNGFEFYNHWMRAGYHNEFGYNKDFRKIQLIRMSRYEYGNAVNDGSGESSMDLETGNYTGKWNYYSYEKEKLIELPTIETKIEFDPIFLDTFSDEIYFKYADKCSEQYYKHLAIDRENNR